MDFLEYKVNDKIRFDNGFMVDTGTVTITDKHFLRADWDMTGINQIVTDPTVISLQKRQHQYKVGDIIDYSEDFSISIDDVGTITEIHGDYIEALWESTGYVQCVWEEDYDTHIRPHQPHPHQVCINAFANGKKIQVRDIGDVDWIDLNNINPMWDLRCEYRVAPVMDVGDYALGDVIEFSDDFEKHGVEDVGTVVLISPDRLYARWNSDGRELSVLSSQKDKIRLSNPKQPDTGFIERVIESYNEFTQTRDKLVLTYCKVSGNLLSVTIKEK